MKTRFIDAKTYPLKKENIREILRECKRLENEEYDEVFFDTFHLIKEKKTIVVFFTGDEPTAEQMRKFYDQNKSTQ